MGSEGTVYIVDDEEPVRRSIARLVRSAGLRAETFSSGQAFLAQKMGDEPACVILDVRLPDQSGFDLQAAMGEGQRSMPIIFITGRGSVPMSVRAMKEGAVDFLEKPFEGEALLESVQHALAKSRQERETETERSAIACRLASLSPRERQVLALVVRGMLNKQIAGILGAAEKTIKIHRGRVMKKMDAASVADLVRMTYTVGFSPTLEPVHLPAPS